MAVQCVGFYTWFGELDEEVYVELYSNAVTDNEAIAAAVASVSDGIAPRIHVRSSGRYLAEVRMGYQKQLIIEKHEEDGTVHEWQVPCLMRLVTNWLDA
jgi:hypothetical protein